MVASPCLITGMMSHVLFWLCGMWLCATNLHIVTHIYCNGMHCHLCWLHVSHGMHDPHLPRQWWWAWCIIHPFTVLGCLRFIIYQKVWVLLIELCIEFSWIGVLTALTSPRVASPVCMNSHSIMLRKVLAPWTEQLGMGSGPGGCLSCNGWHSLRWDAGRLSASGLSAWSSAPQMEDSGLTLQEILCCVFVSGDFLKPYNIYKIKCQHSVRWQATVLWYQSGASHLSC